MSTFFVDVDAGRMNANGTPSLSRNSGSAVVRLNVTVLPLTLMPCERLQDLGVLTQASPPWMTLYQVPAFGLFPILKSRSKVALTSLPVSVLPFENLIPERSLKVHVLPPLVGFGIDSARSGTIFVPPGLPLEAEAQLEDPPLPLGQGVEGPPHALAAERLLGLVEGVGSLAVREEIAELALVVRADGLVQRHRRLRGAERLIDVLDRQAGRLRQLVLGRLAAEPDLEPAGGPAEPLPPPHDVDGDPGRPA